MTTDIKVLQLSTNVFVHSTSWPNVADEINKLTKQCHTCQATINYPQDGSLKSPPSTIPQATSSSQAWSVIYMDAIGPHTFDDKPDYSITVMDSYSSSVIIYPTLSRPTAQDAIDALTTIQRYYHRHPAGLKILTDRGSIFTSTLFDNHIDSIQAEHLLSPVDCGEANGRLERLHREIAHKRRRRCYDVMMLDGGSVRMWCYFTKGRGFNPQGN
ncbi:hypothetical protein FOL47_002097 [Perkinsus chesapeaki]|uniref:Integrase catalytic domain-containing protein n=1 Tax=Perkinsus chesapeaki TaxID=330153 RepID=A0A7J6KQJ6_PERCH|nr:hypothetical protein FOL47_002097 [Perkinsus chesapeaki]